MRTILALAVLVAGCGGDGPTTPPGDRLTGVWTVAKLDIFSNVTLSLYDHGNGTVEGAWDAKSGWGTAYGGPVSGTVNGSAVALTMKPSTACGYGSYSLAVERAGNIATGTATNVPCGGGQGVHVYQLTLQR